MAAPTTALSARARHIGAGATAAIVLLFYIGTLAPGIAFIDAGELIAVTHTLGIAHPTGYPTFTMLGWLWSHLPLGDAAYRMNLFSAVLCAAAVYVFVHLIWLLLGVAAVKKLPQQRQGAQQKGPQRKGAQQKGRPFNGQSVHAQQPLPDWLRLGVAMSGAAVIGLSRTFWSTALSIEVYALHLLLVALVLLAFSRVIFDAPQDEGALRRRLRLFALMLGLAFTNHMTTVMLLPALAVLYFWKNGYRAPAWKRALSALPFFFLGLLPYLYLPLRAMSSPALNWGNPSTLQRFFWHVTGKQYSVWMFSGAEVAGRQFDLFFNTFPEQFAYAGLAVIIPGIVFAFLRSWKLGVMLLLLFAGCLFWAINYEINDIESYFLLAYVTAGIWAALGIAGILSQLRAWNPRYHAGFLIVVPSVMAGMLMAGISERENHLVDDYTDNMFRSMKPNALALSYQWDNWVSASYARQLVMGGRPDVAVIDKELLRRSWYFDQLRRAHPEIYRRSEAEIRAFLPELYKFERNLPYRVEDIEQRYNAVINSMVEKNYGDRPVYLAREMESQFAPDYRRVPEGLLFRVYRPEDVPPPEQAAPDAFRYRRFNREGRLVEMLLGEYANMLLARGVYLDSYRLHRAAAPYYQRALGIMPGNRTILKWKQKNDEALGL